MAFTCSNSRYQTNTAMGHPHGAGHPLGSVFPNPIVAGPDSLWLEHVIERATGDKVFWFMWYNTNGKAAIRASGVFNRDDLRHLANLLIEIP